MWVCCVWDGITGGEERVRDEEAEQVYTNENIDDLKSQQQRTSIGQKSV